MHRLTELDRDSKQAVAFEMFGNIIIDLVFVEIAVSSFDQHLGIIAKFQHGFSSLLRIWFLSYSYYKKNARKMHFVLLPVFQDLVCRDPSDPLHQQEEDQSTRFLGRPYFLSASTKQTRHMSTCTTVAHGVASPM